MKETSRERIVYIEALRVFSALLVIFNHTETDGFFLFSTRSAGSALYWLDLVLAVFCKCAVYVFFSISGAVLLDRKPEEFKVYIRRILKMIVILVLISFVYYLALIIPVGESFDPKALVTMIYTCSVDPRLWFLYMYIAFLISLPFLQIIAASLTDRLMLVIVAVSLLFGSVIPCLQFILFQGKYTITSSILPFITSSIFLYPLLGHYLHNCNLEKARKRLPLLWVVNIVTIVFAGIMVTYESAVKGGLLTEKDSQQFIQVFSAVNTITVWITFRILFLNIRNINLRKAIILFGSSTLGVYLLHPLLLEREWIEQVRVYLINIGCPRMLACYVWVIVTFLITSVMTIIYKKAKQVALKRT